MTEAIYAVVCVSCLVLSFLGLMRGPLRNIFVRLILFAVLTATAGPWLFANSPELAESREFPRIVILVLPGLLMLPFIITTLIHGIDWVKRRALAAKPEDFAGRSAGAQESPSQASNDLQKAQRKLSKNPSHPQNNLNVAQILEKLANYKEAADHYEVAMQNLTEEEPKVQAALKAAEMMGKSGDHGRAAILLNGLKPTITNKMQRMLLEDRTKSFQAGESDRGGWSGPSKSLEIPK